jgi:L-2,4-diaminobutyric acid acetyltransferase
MASILIMVVNIMTKSTTLNPQRVQDGILLRRPLSDDGIAVNRLVARCPPLDLNSIYCNLLQCTHFADTCVAAYQGEELVGFVSGYVVPSEPATLFIWQVVVAPPARNSGLASRMLMEVLERPECRAVSRLHTTVTPDNLPSIALFSRLAAKLSAPHKQTIWFERERHFGDRHPDEILVEIGPFQTMPSAAL